MNIEDIRRKSIEQYASLRRKALLEAQQNAPLTVTPNAAAGSSSGGSSNSSRLIDAGERTFVLYYNNITDSYHVFALDFTNGEFLAELDLKVLGTDYISFDNIIDGKGVSIVYSNNNIRGIIFLGNDCTIVEHIKGITSGFTGRTFEALALGYSYTDPNSNQVVAKVWYGDSTKVNTYRFTDCANDYIWWEKFSGDAMTDDFTGSFYYDTTNGGTKIFLFNKTGTLIEITDLLPDNLEYTYHNNDMHGIGNFIAVTISKPNTTTSVANYTTNDNFITLNAVNPSIFPGDEVTGYGIQSGTYVDSISESGLIITLGNVVIDTGEDELLTFNRDNFDILRIIKTDGTHRDYDISGDYASNIEYFNLIGSDKLAFQASSRSSVTPAKLYHYTHATENLISSSIDYNRWESYSMLYNEQLHKFWDVKSPLGAENMVFMCYSGSNYDGKMNTFTDVKFFWNINGGSQIHEYEHTLATGEEFNFSYDYTSSIPTPAFFTKIPALPNVQIFRLESDGSAPFYDLGVAYTDAGGYYEIMPLGDTYVFLTMYDNAHPNDEIQYWATYDGNVSSITFNSFYTTTDNSWDTSYNVAVLSDNTGDLTWYFNEVIGDFNNVEGAYSNNRSADYNDGYDYVGFHQHGVFVTQVNPYQFYIVANLDAAPALVTIPNGDSFDSIKLNSSNIYVAYADSTNFGIYNVLVYDLEGTLLQTIITEQNNFYDFRVIGNRAIIVQVLSESYAFTLLAPGTAKVEYKPITEGYNWTANDWVDWD